MTTQGLRALSFSFIIFSFHNEHKKHITSTTFTCYNRRERIGYRFMKESTFQANLIRRIKSTFPGCIVLKNDANYIQGFPDLLVLYGDKWAALECKADRYAPLRPNQEYYLDILNRMSYAMIVYPENEDIVIKKLGGYFV